jgi:conjugal transfer mating pair stabilization protein TraN
MKGTSGTSHAQFYSAGGQLLYGLQQSGTTVSTTRYVYLGGKEIAETNNATGTTYTYTDELGSPVASVATIAATLSYSCPSGGTLSGSTCTSTSSSPATPVYACPAGYTLSGTTCSGTTTTAASASWSCEGVGSLQPYAASPSGYMCKTYSISIKLFPDPNGQCQSLAGTLPVVATSSNGTTFTCVVGPVKVYSCPTGATLSGTSCITPVTQAASISGYTCASGTLSGSSCLMTTTTAATGSYSCPSGDTLSGSSCLVVSRTRYEPYGKTAAGTLPTWIGFTGHVNDADTGLVYMQQRYYDPIAARFLSTDPVTTDANTGTAFRRYVYAQSNPYRYTDPDGRQACQFCNWVTIYLSNDYGTHE